MISTVMTVFSWPSLGSSTKLSRPARYQALNFFHWLVRHTVLPVYDHHPATKDGQFNTFICQKLDNASLLLKCRISQHEHHPVFIPHQLDGALYRRLWYLLCMWMRVHSPTHNKDSNRIPRCLVTFPFSDTDKYAPSRCFDVSYLFIWTPLVFWNQSSVAEWKAF